MRRYAFAPSQRPVAHQAIAYIAVNLLGVAQTVAISSGLLRFVLPASGLPISPEALAHVIGVAAPVVTSYFGHRWFTFR
jgi:putative flippase GtrA